MDPATFGSRFDQSNREIICLQKILQVRSVGGFAMYPDSCNSQRHRHILAELHPRPPMQVAFGAYRGAAKRFLHLFPSVYVFVRLYTRRHLLALVSYRSLTIWSDDYSTPPYKPTVRCRTQTLQSHTHKLCKPWSILYTN